MKISFNEVGDKARKYQKQIIRKVEEITRKGIYLHGDENKKLQRNLKTFYKKSYVTLTASGHDSLLIALRSLNLEKNDEVIFPVNSYPTAFPIFLSGANPVPVDCDENGLIDLKEVAKKISENTRAIVVVHLYGLVVDMDELKKIVSGRKITLIEDCAQAFGSLYKNKYVGNFADIACFSFYPTKNLATLGDGGALITKHKKLHNFFQKAVSYGEIKSYRSHFVSGHSRLPEIQAGVLNIYFKSLRDYLKTRKRIHKLYRDLIGKYGLSKFIRVLYTENKSSPAAHVFVIEAKYKNQLKKYLEKKGIPVLVHFPYPVHKLKAFRDMQHTKGSFPIAEKLSKNILSLPFHAHLTKIEVKRIIQELNNFYLNEKTKKP